MNNQNTEQKREFNNDQTIFHTITGNIGTDLELTNLDSGKKVLNTSLAVNTSKEDEAPQWFKVKAWEGVANAMSENVSKGDLVQLRCATRPNAWIDKEGETRVEQVLTVTKFKVRHKKGSSNQ